jgi:hypothetical protein
MILRRISEHVRDRNGTATGFMAGFWLDRARPLRNQPASRPLLREIGLDAWRTAAQQKTALA